MVHWLRGLVWHGGWATTAAWAGRLGVRGRNIHVGLSQITFQLCNLVLELAYPRHWFPYVVHAFPLELGTVVTLGLGRATSNSATAAIQTSITALEWWGVSYIRSRGRRGWIPWLIVVVGEICCREHGRRVHGWGWLLLRGTAGCGGYPRLLRRHGQRCV